MISRRLLPWLPWIALTMLAIGCWAFYETAYSYHFFYKEQNQLFLLSSDYVSTYRGCGWLGRLLGDYLTQYY